VCRHRPSVAPRPRRGRLTTSSGDLVPRRDLASTASSIVAALTALAARALVAWLTIEYRPVPPA
jgi:hypothetical protein